MLRESRRILTKNWSVFVGLAIVLSAVGCQKTEKPSIRVFASPDQAGDALVQAGKSGDQEALVAIFGADAKDLISSGDPVADKALRDRFIDGYAEMHRWRKLADGSQVLLAGADNYPFAIPLRKNAAGQ